MTTPTASTSPTSSLVERLAQQLGASTTAQMVYGTPVEREGVTIIPVASARYGFGGGGGARLGEAEGSGGGAGVIVSPVGYIELREGQARFRRIRGSVLPLVAVSGLIALLLLRSVPKLLPRR